MKHLICILFLFYFSSGNSQNFFRTYYNKLFPNNKTIQIEKLTAQRDSLNHLYDSLYHSQVNALDKINTLKKEVLDLKAELYAEQTKGQQNITKHEALIRKFQDSIQSISFPIVNCREEMIEKKGSSDPIIINTCFWRKYKIIETGTPDYKGRYTWSTEIFINHKDSVRKLSNADLFKPEKINELESMVNKRLEEDFNALRLTETECFSRRRYFPTFKLKDMRLAFGSNSEISFEVLYGFSEACFAVNAASTSIKISDIKDFFGE